MIFLESFMPVLYGYSGIFFGMSLKFSVSGLLHHVKGCQWCLNHLSIVIHNGHAAGNSNSHFCCRKSPENVLSDNCVTSFLIQEHMFSRFPSVSRFLVPLLKVSSTYHVCVLNILQKFHLLN